MTRPRNGAGGPDDHAHRAFLPNPTASGARRRKASRKSGRAVEKGGPLPLFYTALEPLNAGQHGNVKIRRIQNAPAMSTAHAIPVTVDEFALLQRHYPIVFSVGREPVPLALMGLNEGTNAFLDENGLPKEQSLYIPAYLRRYPFLLARLRPDSDELSLCFDPSSGAVGEFDNGEPLFEGSEPSEATKAVLAFCEQFETAGSALRHSSRS